MYFQLLYGVHLEDGTQYKAEFERDEKNGQIKYVSQPVFFSRVDLVAVHGSERFRRLSDKEAKALMGVKDDDAGGQKPKTSDPAKSKKSKVAKAAEKGAKHILEPLGKDVTGRFKGAEKKGLTVYSSVPRKYLVTAMQDGEEVVLTEEPIGKAEVEKLIEEWSE